LIRRTPRVRSEGACGRGLLHMNIGWTHVVRVAQYWMPHEKEPYRDRESRERAATNYARDMEEHLLDRDPNVWRDHGETQRLYEDTHHGWVCAIFGGLCGAD